VILGSFVAMGSYAFRDRLSDVGEWVVVLFGVISTIGCKRPRPEPGQSSRRRFRHGLKSLFSNERGSRRRQLKSSSRLGVRRQTTMC